MQGQLIQEALIRGHSEAPGNHEISFDASDLTSGVYFYKFTSGYFSDTKKMVLLKQGTEYKTFGFIFYEI